MKDFVYLDRSMELWTDIHANHKEAARQRALSLVAAGTKNRNRLHCQQHGGYQKGPLHRVTVCCLSLHLLHTQ